MNEREQFSVLSLELHIYYLRIIKEQSFFLSLILPSKQFVLFTKDFESLLSEVLLTGKSLFTCKILFSKEIVTEHTLFCESGLEIDHCLTKKELLLTPSRPCHVSLEDSQLVKELNERIQKLLYSFTILLSHNTPQEASTSSFTECVQKEVCFYYFLISSLENENTVSYIHHLKDSPFFSYPFVECISRMPLLSDHMLRKANHQFRIIK